jgi:predicted DNA-binding transcriptional regulator AlpA
MGNTHLPEIGYVRLCQIIGNKKSNPPIQGILPISRSSWYEGVKSGLYPQPVKLGSKTSLYRVEDIRELLSRLNSGINTYASTC